MQHLGLPGSKQELNDQALLPLSVVLDARHAPADRIRQNPVLARYQNACAARHQVTRVRTVVAPALVEEDEGLSAGSDGAKTLDRARDRVYPLPEHLTAPGVISVCPQSPTATQRGKAAPSCP